MTTPLLQTKLYIPPIRPELVSRPRLIERLNAGIHRKLSLLSAPAGFGKTTLLSEWARDSGWLVAWLSLDEGDSDPTRFLAYFIAALQTIKGTVGQEVLAALESVGAVNIEFVLTTLLNEIAGFADGVVLVLDDYHLLESQSIDQAVGFILNHLPPRIHLVIATRSDPNIPLARLRGRGQMNELRVADLRFTAQEASAFIQKVVGADIPQEHIAALNTRTEGWIAGLQMAALSMRGVDDIPSFISTFAGDHRYIVDYLVDEVLTLCSPDIRDFLLQTSILERMSAPLCDALSGQADGQTILEKLEQDNLFTIPLDQRREWYRFHHLFAGLLRHRLTQTYPERVEELHARASHWLEDNGFTEQAIKHALAKKDKHLAADLIERHAKTLLFRGEARIQNLVAWFERLPEDMIRERPLLSIYHAWTFVFDNPFENHSQIEGKLAHAQQSLQVVSDKTLEKTVAGHVASIRGFLSQPPIKTDHDPHAVLALLHKAQSLLPPSEIEIRSDNRLCIGYEYMHLEDTKAALKANRAAFAEAQAGNNHLVAIVSIRNQALIAYYVGELDQAVEICRNGIALFDQLYAEKDRFVPRLGILRIMVGYLLIERGELEKAEIELTKGFDLFQWFCEYEALCLGLVALARLTLLKGGDTSALQMGEGLGRHWSTCAALLETLRVQIELSRFEGDPEAMETVLAWMEENQPRFEADSDFQGITPWAETRHLSHLTWIQAQITLSRLESESPRKPVLQSCLDYLDRRLQGAQQRGLVFRIIECSVLKTLVLDALGNAGKAVVTLSQALSLAEPERFRRVFLDKGQPMARLLRQVSDLNPATDFAHQLWTALIKPVDVKTEPPPQPLIEPLSPRELEVLQLVAQGLSNRQISERLFIALSTVKGHNRRIYGKLQVERRTEATARARELGLL